MVQTEKSSNKKRTLFKIFKTTIISILIIILFCGVGATGIVLAMIKTAPPLDVNEILSLNEPSVLYNNKDEYMDNVLTNEKRTVITYKEMPEYLKDAFISIEDERFRTHIGIDFKRVASVVYHDIINKIKKQNDISGASTITQQLVKNRLFLEDSLTNRISPKRKIQEMYLAIELEKHLTKDQILEAYLNTIFLGGSAHGVDAAANQYFNKKAKDLNLIESAFLAGITHSPSYYDPFSDAVKKNPSRYINRTVTVLDKMLENGHITKDEHDKAVTDLNNKKLVFTPSSTNANKLAYEWFSLPVMEQVKEDLQSQYHYNESEINSLFMYGGLKIYTTMDKDLQDSAQKILDDDKNYNIKSSKDAQGITQPQAAAVIMDYRTGEVLTIIGGRGNQPPRSFNRAAFNGSDEFRRPTGSSIKPLSVYSPAIDTKIATAATVVEDSPLPEEIGKKYGEPGKPYDPKNYDTDGFRGYVTIRDAITSSINLVAIKLEDQIGLKTGAAYAEKFGLTLDEHDKTSISALALGQLHHRTNPLTMAAAYGVFGNSGMYTNPKLYRKVVDKNGRVILENKTLTRKVLSPQSAYVMYDLLKGPTSDYGTAPNARFSDMPVAGKTGTSGNKQDFWFCGLTPYYSGAVWIGDDYPKTHNDIFSSTSAGLWSKIMTEAHKNLAVKDLEEPSGLSRSVVCKESGTLPSDLCAKDQRGNTTYSELFIDGTVPTSICDTHVEAKINKTNGKLATDSTPKDLIESKVFIKRAYTPTAALDDQQYVLPKDTDDSALTNTIPSGLNTKDDETTKNNDTKASTEPGKTDTENTNNNNTKTNTQDNTQHNIINNIINNIKGNH